MASRLVVEGLKEMPKAPSGHTALLFVGVIIRIHVITINIISSLDFRARPSSIFIFMNLHFVLLLKFLFVFLDS